MEDKGMEEERAKNFQRMVVRRLQELETGNLNPETGTLEPNYQLIFATSSIADELNTRPTRLVKSIRRAIRA